MHFLQLQCVLFGNVNKPTRKTTFQRAPNPVQIVRRCLYHVATLLIARFAHIQPAPEKPLANAVVAFLDEKGDDQTTDTRIK